MTRRGPSRRSVFLGTVLPLLLVLVGCGGRVPVAAGSAGGSGTIEVTVTGNSGPASGAQVSLHDANDQDLQDGTTDSNGTYTFSNVPVGGTYRVIASLGGASGGADHLLVPDSTPVTCQISLGTSGGAGGTLTGTVEVSGQQYGIPNATVAVRGTKLTTTTDQEGRFMLSGVPPGQQQLTANAPGFTGQDRDLSVSPGQSAVLVFDLEPLSAGPRAGHILVTLGDRVVEYDQWHDPVHSFSVSHGTMAVCEPQSGNTLVTDQARNEVLDVDPSGNVLSRFTDTAWYKLGFGGLSGPLGATRAPNGDVVIADSGNNRVVELDSSNHQVWSYSSGLSSPGSAQRCSDGGVLICDTGNNRVLEVGSGNSIIWAVGDGTLGILNHPSSAFRIPDSAPEPHRGNTLICDTGNNRVMEVVSQPGSPNSGDYLWMIGGPNPLQDPVPDLNHPSSAVYLDNGDVLIADTGNNRVIEVNPNNQVVWKLPVASPLFADKL